jgi:LAO/AO transport system kinase
MQLSALQGQGVGAFWQAVLAYQTAQGDPQTAGSAAHLRRRQQALDWMWERITSGLKERFMQHPEVRARLRQTEGDVLQHRVAPSTAARNLIDLAN